MDERRFRPSNVATPEIREAIRSQVVTHGRLSSAAIAAELELPHPTVVRVLQRFAAVGALALDGPSAPGAPVEVVADSLSARFRDLALALW
jgi:hypothetical protein